MENSKETQTLNTEFPLLNLPLPNQWTLYLYDKQLFKKMANRPNFAAKPHKEICTISTVNDLAYILQLMQVKCHSNNKADVVNNKINLDCNDYIIMRKGIEPIWEDPKNSNGGTFTIKMDHSRGYEVWSDFVMHMLGETLTEDMQDINGITVSYISDSYNFSTNSGNGTSYTYIKIWDGKLDRTRDHFIKSLPIALFEKIKMESLLYSPNNKKRDFKDKNIIGKLMTGPRNHTRERGGFNQYYGGRGRGGNRGRGGRGGRGQY